MIFKFLYHIKINIKRYLLFLISFTIMILSSSFTFSKIIESKSNYDSFKSSNNEDVWYMNVPNDKECYMNLNEGFNFQYNGLKLYVDPYMQMKNVEYKDNLLGFYNILNSNECVISKNIAVDKNINIGDIITVFEYKEISFKVKGFIKAIDGIDPDYNRYGVMILGNNEKFDKKQKNYVIFSSENGLAGSGRPIGFKTKMDYYKKIYINNIYLYIVISLVMFLLEYLFISRKFKKDYYLDIKNGISRKYLFGKIVLDNIIKILLPFMIVSLTYLKYIHSYINGYIAMNIIFGTFYIVIFILSISMTSIRSFNYGKSKSSRY